MRFQLTLAPSANRSILPVNYQYPLAAAIYRIIQQADEEYADFLHESGYGKTNTLKKFKLFTFSDLRVPFQIRGDRLYLADSNIQLTVCFHISDAAENFIKGLFMNQRLDIADEKSKASFTVQQVEAINPLTGMTKNNGMVEALLQPMSPIVTGKKNFKGNYDYLSPEDEDFIPMLKRNIMEKYDSLNELSNEDYRVMQEKIRIKTIFFSHPPRSRLITIKAATEAETKVRGFDKFRLRIKAPEDVLELILNSGCGIYNAMGMGCVGVVERSNSSKKDLYFQQN
jgi:CRISPR-associated endoribonuclease Cas6